MKIDFILNGKKVSVETDPRRSLLNVLREDFFLTGTKEGCGKGECGACTVLLGGDPVNSCLVPAAQAEGKNVLTIEGMSSGEKLDPIQEAFIDEGAVQCGFCIPGMVLTAKSLLDKKKDPSVQEIKKAISGNICRCTGYTKIIQAIRKAAKGISGKKQ